MSTYKFEGKKGRMYTYDEKSIKENSNCPASEKQGTGPGSCGGSTGKSSVDNKATNDNSKYLSRADRIVSKMKINAPTVKKWDKLSDKEKNDFAESLAQGIRSSSGPYQDDTSGKITYHEPEKSFRKWAEPFKAQVMKLMDDKNKKYLERKKYLESEE